MDDLQRLSHRVGQLRERYMLSQPTDFEETHDMLGEVSDQLAELIAILRAQSPRT